ncbi:pentapeptide repeat-containing protein [Amycolatopsis taiwanensis]|uniref:pentapeptide repeat-containing protein n=1 Tax=Amycolatopsis taiwanensis TaxID=342230 RepID=UPI000489E56F|nr:pentapeptide repeat-containing protein [Amycolatopsis taiwanensis]
MRERGKTPRGPSPLVLTFALSVVLLVAVSGWLLTDPATTRADALRTGGLAAGAVVALYALWLNDRRRQVEEGRQRVERERHELELLRAERDRERVTDERFARSVELLGHDADQVRVGALHALAALARDRADYSQTVLDVLCSYLRRPFENPNLGKEHNLGDESGLGVERDLGAERELQVRLTAQRLIVDLLPPAGSEQASFDLDLTGASLEYFDLSGRKIGELSLRRATLLSRTNFNRCEITGPAWFTDATFGQGRLRGHFHCQGATFHDRAWFHRTEFGFPVYFTDTAFRGESNFRKAIFADEAILRDASFGSSLDLDRARFAGYADLRMSGRPDPVSLYNTLVDPGLVPDLVKLPPFWTLSPLPDGSARITDPRS